MSDPLKISQMPSNDEEYRDVFPFETLERREPEYDENNGSVIDPNPIAFHAFYINGAGTPSGFSDDFDEKSAIPIVKMGERDITPEGYDGRLLVPASLNKKTSAVGLMRHHMSNRRRVMKTNFDLVNVSKDLDPFKIVTLDHQGFMIDDSVAQTKYYTGRAFFTFGYVTAGYADIPNSEVDPYEGLTLIGKKRLNKWGDRIRFGASIIAPLAIGSHFDSYLSTNVRLNLGFGNFLSRVGGSFVQPDDTATTYGICVNIRNGAFVVDWSFASTNLELDENDFRQGSYNTGIACGNSDSNSGEISVVMDLDLKKGMRITFASPEGEIYTINFPLLDRFNVGAGMTWDELFTLGGIDSLPHDEALSGVGLRNDDYYRLCCILSEFFTSGAGDDFLESVAFGMSRQQYPFFETNDSGLAEQQVNDSDDPPFTWADYDPLSFRHSIELISMYFETEFDLDSDSAGAFGRRFNLAVLGRDALNELDQFVQAGGNAQYDTE